MSERKQNLSRSTELDQLQDPRLLKEFAYVAGKWQSASSGKVIDVTNPANNSWIGSVPSLSKSESIQAIAARGSTPPRTMPIDRLAAVIPSAASTAKIPRLNPVDCQPYKASSTPRAANASPTAVPAASLPVTPRIGKLRANPATSKACLALHPRSLASIAALATATLVAS